jgi:hypothetical protein
MATQEQKQELVDNIKGFRHYNIQINGYGGEHAYATLTKEQYDFWKPVVEEHGDGDLCNYLLNAEDGEFDFENIEKVPPHADFLMSADADGKEWRSPWFEMPTEFEHVQAVSYDSAHMYVTEVADEEYNSPHIKDVIDNESPSELNERIGEETDWEYEVVESQDDVYPEKGTYILQMLSMEKGNFFDGIVKTTGDFDPKKLKIQINETVNGEDIISGILYDGVEVDNNGGDTNGKGYSASVWQQEF